MAFLASAEGIAINQREREEVQTLSHEVGERINLFDSQRAEHCSCSLSMGLLKYMKTEILIHSDALLQYHTVRRK